jgi:hypothetical protein
MDSNERPDIRTNIKRIPVTKARNNFFKLLKKSYLENQVFLLEKGGIPLAYISPAQRAENKSPIKSQPRQGKTP